MLMYGQQQQQQAPSWFNALIARDMEEHVNTNIKLYQERERCKGKSRNEDRHEMLSVLA